MQYFGSNGDLLNTGFNHTLLLQCLVCVSILPFLYNLNKIKTFALFGILIFSILISAIHYEIVSSVNGYFFDIFHLWSYVKFHFYLFTYLTLYYFFKGSDFHTIVKVAKFILLVLFFESLLFSIFKTIGLLSLAELFDSVEGRFAGIFLMHNSLVGLFALFVMSYIVFYGSLSEKFLYLTVGIFLIILTGERSLVIGLMFFIFAYILFSYDENDDITKDRIKIFFIFSLFLVIFVVLFTVFIRGYNIQSLGEFLRPLSLRIYYSYLSIVHIFESNSSIVGFGPFIENLPTNYSDIYSDYVEKFIKIVKMFFGEGEETFFRDFHDSGNIESPSYIVNAHNTFVVLFFKFGYLFIGLLLYFIYTLFVASYDIKRNPIEFFLMQSNLKQMKNKYENFFLLSSLTFIISCFPSLFFLSLENYLILVVIALGQIGSYIRNE